MSEVVVHGESDRPAPAYELLRTYLEDLFAGSAYETGPVDVALRGIAWQIISGRVNAPGKVIDNYELTCGRRDAQDGTWYQAEYRDKEGRPFVQYVYTPDEAYRLRPEEVSIVDVATFDSQLGVIQVTEFTPGMSLDAALRAQDNASAAQ